MPGLVRGEVVAADDAWVHVPDDGETVRTDDYLLLLAPAHWASTAQVLRTHADRAPGDLVAEVLGLVREHHRPDLTWWVRDGVRPAGLEEHLTGLGARRDETLTVLARALDEPLPPAPDEPDVRAVTDRAAVEADHRIGVEVFDETMPSDDELSREVERLHDADRTELKVLAYLDGRAVGMGGVSVVDGVARLWGGGTLPAYRRRGVYAAVLRARLDWAREHGARLALTRGRVETSAPLLRRVGFEAYGEKRSYRLQA